MAIILTGSTGFLGGHLTDFLLKEGISVFTPVRKTGTSEGRDSDMELTSLSDLTEEDLQSKKINVFIHCAGLAHKQTLDRRLYIKVNTELTLLLAERAASSGVKRFIFFSSIGVNGSSTLIPFSADDTPKPYDGYTDSKYEAEEGLKAISQKTGMEVVIIRPPLIYGRGAHGNFAKFVKLAKLPIPKPLGAIHNKRSFISVDNLNEFTHLCLTHPNAANETFLVSDGEDLSTPDFLRKISKALGKPVLLVPVSVSLLRIIGKMIGKEATIDKLAVDLQIDIKKNQDLLGWTPSLSVDAALERTFSSC